MNSPRAKSYAFLLIASAIWGIAGPVIKYTLGFIPPFIFLAYRFGLAALVGVILLKFSRHKWPTKTSDIVTIFIYSFLTSTVSLGLLFIGYEHTSAISGSLINALYPIMVAAVGAAFLHEHVTRREQFGMGIAFLGTVLVAFEPGSLVGNLYILASLVVGVVLAVMAKLLLRHLQHLAFPLTQLSFIIGFITVIPITFYLYDFDALRLAFISAPLSAHLGVLYMALVSGTLAYSMWHQAQKTIEIGETAVFSYTYPLFTLPLSLFWLHETISLPMIAGAIVIAIGVIIAETKKSRHHPDHPR